MIKYNSLQSIEKSNISEDKIKEELQNYLREHRASNIVAKNNKIYFDNRGGLKGGVNYAYMTRIVKGDIEIEIHNNIIELKYNSYISIVMDLVLISIFLLIGIFFNKFLLFGVGILFFQMLYYLLATKGNSDDFLEGFLDKIAKK